MAKWSEVMAKCGEVIAEQRDGKVGQSCKVEQRDGKVQHRDGKVQQCALKCNEVWQNDGKVQLEGW